MASNDSLSEYGRLCHNPLAVDAWRVITENVPMGVGSTENSRNKATKAASIPKAAAKMEHKMTSGSAKKKQTICNPPPIVLSPIGRLLGIRMNNPWKKKHAPTIKAQIDLNSG